MKAAVVEAFGQPPVYREFDTPAAAQPGDVLIAVRAAGLSRLARSQASGKHYSSAVPPLVPGADGVGTTPGGQRVYFAFPRAPFGSMAEQTSVAAENLVRLPDDVDDITAAAIANPAMSSWAALTARAHVQPGECVLVNGANGTSGRLAIQIARHLGAGRIVATARSAASEPALRALGADDFVCLSADHDAVVAQFREQIARGTPVVLDYLWGAPAEAFLDAATGHGGREAAPRIRFVNIGSLAGAGATVNAAALRSSGIELLGSGLGSLSHAALITAVGGVMAAIRPARLHLETQVYKLAEVQTAWDAAERARIVFTT